ncbi:hypothetical protein Dimus_027587 [Dionaea muscipula]
MNRRKSCKGRSERTEEYQEQSKHTIKINVQKCHFKQRLWFCDFVKPPPYSTELRHISLPGSSVIFGKLSVSLSGGGNPRRSQIVKKNNAFLVKEFGNGTAKVQFSKESNNLFNSHYYKYSGLTNKKTITIQAAGKDGVLLATSKTKKQNKPATALHKSVLKKEFRRMAKAVINQVLCTKFWVIAGGEKVSSSDGYNYKYQFIEKASTFSSSGSSSASS